MLAALWLSPVPVCLHLYSPRIAAASVFDTTDYCYRTEVDITPGTSAFSYTPVSVKPINTNAFQAQGTLRKWNTDILPTTSDLSEIQVTAQDFCSSCANTATRWWFLVPSGAVGTTQVFYAWTGNSFTQRNQPALFGGNDYISRADEAATEVTDNFQVNVAFDTDLATTTFTSPAWLVDKYDFVANTGYAVGIIDVSGTRKLRVLLDGTTNDFTVDDGTSSSYNAGGVNKNLKEQIQVLYKSGSSPNLTVTMINGSTGTSKVQTAATGIGAITTNTKGFYVGAETSCSNAVGSPANSCTNGYKGAIFNVKLLDHMDTTARLLLEWGFAPAEMKEGSVGDPIYTGTVTDQSPNTRNGTWVYDRPQTGITVSIGATATTFADPALTISTHLRDTVGNPTNPNKLFVREPAASFIPGYSSLTTLQSTSGIPRTFFWLILLGLGIGAPVGLLLYKLGRDNLMLGLLGPFIAYVLGAVTGLLEPAWILLYGMLAIAAWSSWQFARS